jgi:uncharacterized metal-binding protein
MLSLEFQLPIQNPKSKIQNPKSKIEMPSGKTHDAITFLLVAPTFAVTWKITENIAIATVVMVAMLVGGLMFGPDLDTHSKQYTRWGIFSFLWYPYKVFFKHRSRWSHGLLFGTLFRVIYFMGALTLCAFLIVYAFTAWQGGSPPDLFEITKVWGEIGEYVHQNVGENALIAVFAGLWIGAASHTLTDMAGSFIKHGRIGEFI